MDSNDTFPEELMQELAARGAVPKPRWQFLLSRSVIWLLALASVVVGGVAFAIAEFVFFDNDGIAKLQGSSIQDIAQSIPFVWLAITAFFAVVAYYGLRRTRRGYRYATTTLVLIVVVLSLALGVLLNYFDFGQRIYEYVGHQIPLSAVFTGSTDGLN
ncbi:MAG: hypothetical protein KGI78_02360 [Patescibacteria group bacterium]|nr:hypothetical protein [Patescibacteria group bacterium]MDE1945140.1 hypothetical protein [Patescibacteria group bacterium]MDE2057675.1 hypothetical protein [Patescibacteria group bacterium]